MNLPHAHQANRDSTTAFDQARQSFLQGVEHFEAERFDAARLAFELSLKLLPGRASTLGNLGATHLKLGNPEQALPLLAQAIAIASDDIDAWCQHGLALAALDRPQEALASFDEVLQRDSGHLPAAYQQSLVLVALQRYNDALVTTGRLVALDPSNEPAWWVKADVLHRLGRLDEALAAYSQLLAINPALDRAWSQRGGILKDMGRHAEAVAAFRRALKLGGDLELNGYFLAALLESSQGPRSTAETDPAATPQAMPASAPRHYVEALFDDYAEQFDAHLVGQLGYRAHVVLVEQLLALPEAAGRRFASALDLGCGTGLCGPLLQSHTERLTGLDLSKQMLEKARATGAYQVLLQADVNAHLARTTARHDLVLSADVFIYVGALESVFAGAARALDAGGIFCFSVERADDAVNMKLTRGLRYAHSSRYLLALADANGFKVLKLLAHPIRQDQLSNIDGLFVYLLKAS